MISQSNKVGEEYVAVITFMSDFGLEDHYVAVVKAALLKDNPSQTIVDLSHQINPFDVSQAAYVLKNCYHEFPKGSIHLVAVESSGNLPSQFIVVRLDGHWFIGPDSGLFSLISNASAELIVKIPSKKSSFPAKDLLAPVASKIARGVSATDIGEPIQEMKRLMIRTPKVTKREIVGAIVRIDSYGNLISNIDLSEFTHMHSLNNQGKFTIEFGKESFTRFHVDYSNVEPGDCYILFNSTGKLQIGINKGNAHELLGLRLDSPVYIYFE